jgi:hypothetical protein
MRGVRGVGVGMVAADLTPSRMLKNPLTGRLFKKAQMQGGAPGTHPEDGCRREAYLPRTSQRRASARGTHPQDGSRQMGLFQQPASVLS